jgi:CopG family nickel-responsive transcriptional regulator
MSLPTKLLVEFDKSMLKSGYTDRSKALQTAIHSFVNDYDWNTGDKQFGAGAIIIVYDNRFKFSMNIKMLLEQLRTYI